MTKLACVLLLLVAAGIAGQTTPTVSVSPGESLQAAIDSAPPGSVLKLAPGSWQENITITKPLTLEGTGSGKTIIAGNQPGQPVILISGDDISVVLSKMTIGQPAGTSCASLKDHLCPHGVSVQGRARVQLFDCTIEDSPDCGLYITDRASVLAMNTSFTGNQRAGIWAEGESRLQLISGRITGNGYGAVAADRASLTLRRSRLLANKFDGLLAADRAHVYLWENEIAGNGRAGVCLDIPGCYHTSRAFSGLVRGAGNEVPGPDESGGNRRGAFCPAELAPIATPLGGIYPPPNPAQLLPAAPCLGDPHAPVTMLEFSDLSCPYCARFARKTFPELKREFIDTGRVKLYFFPFPVHGKPAEKEAEAGFCAAAQGKFWEFQKAMFDYAAAHSFPTTFSLDTVAKIITDLGGDPDALADCLTQGRYSGTVQAAIAVARELGVQGTPTFFIGRWAVPGAYPYQVFQTIIQRALGEQD